MTISQAHRDRLKALHERDPKFGVIGHLWADRVIGYIHETGSQNMLDYGAGRSGLAFQVIYKMAQCPAFPANEYEPALDIGSPEPHDFVTCIDVLEHVEKYMLESVLLDLRRCMLKGGLITISLRNASQKKRLTHPLVLTREQWTAKMRIYFCDCHGFSFEEVDILDPAKSKSEVAFLVRKK